MPGVWIEPTILESRAQHLKATIYAIPTLPSDTHQLQFIKLHHFKQRNILIDIVISW